MRVQRGYDLFTGYVKFYPMQAKALQFLTHREMVTACAATKPILHRVVAFTNL